MRYLVLTLCLAGCAAPMTASVTDLKPALPEQVASCAYIDDIVGTSGWYGVFATKGIAAARGDIIERAKEAGATHLVWQSASSNYGNSVTSAKAYRCPS